MNAQMQQSTTSTVLLRGGHRWACASADAQAALAYLRAPGADLT